MRLRTLSSKFPILRKDIFRFAPVWVGYFLLCLPTLYAVEPMSTKSEAEVMILIKTLGKTGAVNMVYAGLVAMLLFGDLFSESRCQALHAMPMRREKWYVSHVFNGLLYSVLPNVLLILCLIPKLGGHFYLGFVWVLGMTLQYLFFFGLAVLCVFLSGNQIGMLTVYGFLNYVYVMFHWIIQKIFLPYWYGIPYTKLYPGDPGYAPCPVMRYQSRESIFGIEGWWYLEKPPEMNGYIEPMPEIYKRTGFTEEIDYYVICAGIGILLLGLALLLYRKRKLECAGDLMAHRGASGVFSAVFPVFSGYVVTRAFGYIDTKARNILWGDNILLWIYGISLVVMWFVGQMLLQRSVKIFRKKTVLRFAVFAVSVSVVSGLLIWDPVGVTRYVPEADSVQEVELTPFNHKSLDPGLSSYILHGTDPEMIESIVAAQEQILKDGQNGSQSGRVFSIRYTLSSGKQVVREYNVARGTQAWQCLREIWNTPEHLLGYTDWETWHGSVWNVRLNQYTVAELQEAYKKQTGQQWLVSTQQMEEELLRALVADVEEGHAVDSVFRNEEDPDYFVQLTCSGEKRTTTYYVRIGKEARHCYAWMEKYCDLMELVEWRL